LPKHGFSPACQPGILEPVVEMFVNIFARNCFTAQPDEAAWQTGWKILLMSDLRKN
jgi:hypothetical protein